MFVPAAMTRTQMTSTGVLVGSVAGAVIVLLAVVAVAVVIVVFRWVTHLYTWEIYFSMGCNYSIPTTTTVAAIATTVRLK